MQERAWEPVEGGRESDRVGVEGGTQAHKEIKRMF